MYKDLKTIAVNKNEDVKRNMTMRFCMLLSVYIIPFNIKPLSG